MTNYKDYINYDDFLKSFLNKEKIGNCIYCDKPLNNRTLYHDRHKKCHNIMIKKQKRNHRTDNWMCVICNKIQDDRFLPFCKDHTREQSRTLFHPTRKNLYDAINYYLEKKEIKPYLLGYLMPNGDFYHLDAEKAHGDLVDSISYALNIFGERWSYVNYYTHDSREWFLKTTGAIRIGTMVPWRSITDHTYFEYYDIKSTQINKLLDLVAQLPSTDHVHIDSHGHGSEKLLRRKMDHVILH